MSQTFSTSLQFHMIADEAQKLFGSMLTDRNLEISILETDATKFRRYNAHEFIPQNCRIIAFSHTKQNAEAKNLAEFLRLNHEQLILEIGELKNNTLSESKLWTISQNKNAVEKWRRSIRPIRASMNNGAFAINPTSGKKSFYKAHPFTDGAYKVYMNGVAILPVAGNSIIKLWMPSDESREDPR